MSAASNLRYMTIFNVPQFHLQSIPLFASFAISYSSKALLLVFHVHVKLEVYNGKIRPFIRTVMHDQIISDC